ncbi:MAG: hypothetical protein ACHREM_29190, partial [Polyangiales bacterium]
LTPGQRRWVRFACLLPFVWFNGNPVSGTWFLLGERVHTWVYPYADLLFHSLRPAVAATPLLVFAWLRFGAKVRLPFISFLVVASNAIWWTLFDAYGAFVWATVFHSIQYLFIVEIFHAKDRPGRPDKPWSGLVNVGAFYGACLGLAFVLFVLWPRLYRGTPWHGGNVYEVVVASVNLHHFIVDGFIWKLRKDPSNRAVVEALSARA